jgi:tRNA-dihydrouridine synthase A
MVALKSIGLGGIGAKVAKLGEEAGFDEINLNVGCPSDRVQSGAFGACLMANPPLVASCIAGMRKSVSVPVTVKCRIGIDDRDSEGDLIDFVRVVAGAGCKIFIIHARKAILSGLSPKENRQVPPLNYERVYAIKALFPELDIVLNGGVTSLDTAEEMLQTVDGVMLGREAYQNPYLLHGVDSRLFGEIKADKNRLQYIYQYLPYIEQQLSQGTPLQHMSRHLLGLFRGQKGGKQYRRHLSENSYRKDAGIEVLLDAINHVNC